MSENQLDHTQIHPDSAPIAESPKYSVIKNSKNPPVLGIAIMRGVSIEFFTLTTHFAARNAILMELSPVFGFLSF